MTFTSVPTLCVPSAPEETEIILFTLKMGNSEKVNDLLRGHYVLSNRSETARHPDSSCSTLPPVHGRSAVHSG